MILSIDLGTTNTKAALWAADGLRAIGRAPVTTVHPVVGWAEQDPAEWWPSVVAACRAVGDLRAVEAVGFSSARQTFVPVGADGATTGAALLWSDRRAREEAAALSRHLGGVEAVRTRTGMVLDSAAVAAKIAWLQAHQPERLAGDPLMLGARDLVVWRLTGEVVTDWTQASATGLYSSTGAVVAELSGGVRLPLPVEPTTVVGAVSTGAAAELGLRPGVPVVVGAGDRQCEVLGSGATAARPMVSWGTTANVSVPADEWPSPLPQGVVVTRGAAARWQIEAGLSAAGSLLAWLGDLTRSTSEELLVAAGGSPPGARGVVALPWLGGARAPWWRDGAGAAFLGLGPAHGPADLARACLEGVAWDVARCVRAVAGDPGSLEGLALSGAGGAGGLSAGIVTAVVGVTGLVRASAEAALAGAALLTASGTGEALELDRINPVVDVVEPEPVLVEAYAGLRAIVDAAAEAVIAIDGQ